MKRDVHAWAKRVRMSPSRLWAVVEGPNHDTPFYEGLLTDGAGVESVEVVKAEDIEVDGSSAGGKPHALKVFRVLEEVGGLRQENRATKIDVVFFLDRDDDDYLGSAVGNDHVQYTHYSDVEAEIIGHADIPLAISRAFSVSRTEAAEHAPVEPASDLARLWAEWITLRLAAAMCGWGDTRFSQPSQINISPYGGIDKARAEPIIRRVKDEKVGWDLALEGARQYVSEVDNRGDSARLVKGKWLPSFIVYRVNESFGAERSLPRVDAAHFVTACLATIDFPNVWADRYECQFESILKR